MNQREYPARFRGLRTTLSLLFASVASAGLMVTTSQDLNALAAVRMSDIVLLPGLILIGALISMANDDDLGRATLVLLGTGVIGATLTGLALASPGFAIAGVRTAMIDRGTMFGFLALLMIILFGLMGIAASWLVTSFWRPDSI